MIQDSFAPYVLQLLIKHLIAARVKNARDSQPNGCSLTNNGLFTHNKNAVIGDQPLAYYDMNQPCFTVLWTVGVGSSWS